MKGPFSYLPSLLVLVAGCNPYDDRDGEFNAGPVDPANFPAAYLGVGADTPGSGLRSGRGSFFEVRAYANGGPTGYYNFPFSDTQVRAGDPLRILDDNRIYTAVPAPIAYVFDPSPPVSPFPSTQQCRAPPNYRYDQRTADVHLDEQGNVFTQLPFANARPGVASTFSYVPIVAEVAVSASGMACQSIKSERTLKKVFGDPRGTGNFLLWAIIDPAAGVYRFGQQSTFNLPDGGNNPAYATGVGVQKYGWFGRYYLAYIDGGYIPTHIETVTERVAGRDVTKQIVRMDRQRLYLPRAISSEPVTCSGTTCTPGQACTGTPPTCQNCTSNNQCPSGFTCQTAAPRRCTTTVTSTNVNYGVLQARRRDSNYSPVCQVYQYNATLGPGGRLLAASELPKSEADILANYPVAVGSDPLNISFYCPQVD